MADILIVEDEVLVAYDMEATLEESGHRCVGIAPDLKTAESFFETAIDLALVDLNLRDGLTGPQIGLKLSAVGVPVIFITANPAQIGDGVAGTIGVITKPTDDKTLLEAVNYALSRKHGFEAQPPASLKLFG
ncbi:response regulator [Alteraurantiacibacter buctensis]|uniref:Response regulator n=1 Tax=Alteraurantiacibacter buctensis TaxID=1503981 RepID=A0A844YY87_9SPHN|nr:response regulator [Alteraurantiacibacter buctensis]MXO71047.1 response regulator [Alteraurantiacibacter buctensis]